MSACKVSVCIPTYNYGNFIAETIESVLGQSFTDFELLIIDDCSSDETAQVVESYAMRDPRIRFLINTANLGMVENWNSCLAQAKGEYIKFVFGDDLLASPSAVERMVSLLDDDKSISLVSSSRTLIDKESHVLKEVSFFETGTVNGPDVINHCLVHQKNFIGEPSVVMFRKSQSKRGFNPMYKQLVDLEMWFHLLEQGSFAYINEPLCSFRLHNQQQSEKNKDNFSVAYDIFYLMNDYLDKEYITLSLFMRQYLRYEKVYGIFKIYRNGLMKKETARELIERHYGFARFVCGYPLYKLVKPCLKIVRKSSTPLMPVRKQL